MEYLSIIPARGGSKGLPNKNVKQLLGKPLIAWTIQQSLEAKQISHTVVTTDSVRIAKIAEAFGAGVPFRRPPELSDDVAPLESALLHCLAWHEKFADYVPDAVVLLPCTSPVRKKGRISEAIRQFEESGADSLVSVSPFWNFLWEETDDGKPKALYDYKNRKRRQEVLDAALKFKENGSIYIIKTDVLKKLKNRVAGDVSLFKMSVQEGYVIDTAEDFEHVQLIMRNFMRKA